MLHTPETNVINHANTVKQLSALDTFFHRFSFTNSAARFVTAYTAYLIKENDIRNEAELTSFIEDNLSEQRQLFLKEYSQECLMYSFMLAEDVEAPYLIEYIKYYPREQSKFSYDYATPEAVSKLALRILGVNEGETLADFGSGAGDFIVYAGNTNEKTNTNTSIYGIELMTQLCEISRIRAEVLGIDTSIELGNMFNIPESRRFDKIFSNYPFGVKPIQLSKDCDYYDSLIKRIPAVKRIASSDWIFNSLIIDHLAENGKAVAIMTNGSTWNTLDQQIREYFVSNGFVEAVIALPGRLFDYTNIPTAMIVLSRNNKSVRLINAISMCEQGRRQAILTQENTDDIIKSLTEDSEVSVCVDNDTLRKNDYVLNPARYTEVDIEIKDGVEFGSLIKRLTRGAQISAQELDQLVSDVPTDIQYLMLSHIQEGLISENLPYLKELDSRLEKYCIKNHNLLLSKNGAPFKVAISENKDDTRLLGNGNLYIIELDEEKVNPFYLKAFFDSEVGMKCLNSISVGSSIPNIPAEALKKLMVPLPSMEEQNEIAQRYQAKADEVRVLQFRLKKAQSELKGIFGEVK